MISVWGFANCSTVKKACKWLREHDFPFSLIDTKKHAPDIKILSEWTKQIGLETLFNVKSTSWRLLSVEEKNAVNLPNSRLALMVEKPALIKRPIITSDETGKIVLAVGFDSAIYEKKLIYDKQTQ